MYYRDESQYTPKRRLAISDVNKLDFSGQQIYVGMDVHKNSWSVSIFTEQLEPKTFSQPPQVAVRKDPALLMAFNELCKRTTKTKAIVKIARKLLNRIRYVLKNQEEYVPAVVQ